VSPVFSRKHLAMALSKVPDPPTPRPDLEQIRTPGTIAADLLLTVDAADPLEGRRVIDLGSGTGVLAIGAALLGAETVLGVELEPKLVALAEEAARQAEVDDCVRFQAGDVATTTPESLTEAVGGPVDLVLMNPPFGADTVSRARGGDRVFLSLAFRLAPVIYSFHLAETESFLAAYARDAGYEAERAYLVAWPLQARFLHHKDAVRHVAVGVYRFKKP
jgi:putative methylase